MERCGLQQLRLLPLLIAVVASFGPAAARAATFAATSFLDTPDAVPGDGICATAEAVCTLRAAVQEANALEGPDTIVLSPGTYGFTIAGTGEDAAATGDLDITGDLTLSGPTLGNSIISANGLDRVLDILSGATVTISRVTIQNGNLGAAGAAGAGIRNSGMLTLSTSAIRANTATNGDGGGLANRNGGTALLTNVTISGNVAAARGGGIANDTGGTLQLTNLTISGNSALNGGGLDNFGVVQMVNTIVAAGITGGTCSGAVGGISLGHNIDSSITCLFSGTGDLSNTNPNLGVLTDANGGFTFTHALLAGSPAIDGGDNAFCPFTDQRGQLRPADGNNDGMFVCDIGAYELTGPVLPTATATATDTATPTPTETTTAPLPSATSTPTATATSASAAISLSRVTGIPGQHVIVMARLSTKGASIARTENDIAFDSLNAPISMQGNGTPQCIPNAAIGKNLTTFVFQPDACSGMECTSVHAEVLGDEPDPIPDATVLYTCVVDISPTAPPAEYPLTISGVVLRQPDGETVPDTIGSSGAVVVILPTPTQTPGASDCCQCSGPSVCGPAAGGCGDCQIVFDAACEGATGLCVPFTKSPTATLTVTASPTPSSTASPTPTNTATPTSTNTATPTPTVDGSPTITATLTPTEQLPPTNTPTGTPTSTATASPTATATTVSETATPTATATGTLVASETPQATATPTVSGTPTATVESNETPTSTATVTPTSEGTPAGTETPSPPSTLTPTTVATPTTTASATATPTPTLEPTTTATPPRCAGDCDGSGDVTITEILQMVNIALGNTPVTDCAAGDINGDGGITVDEILVAIGNIFEGCPA